MSTFKIGLIPIKIAEKCFLNDCSKRSTSWVKQHRREIWTFLKGLLYPGLSVQQTSIYFSPLSLFHLLPLLPLFLSFSLFFTYSLFLFLCIYYSHFHSFSLLFSFFSIFSFSIFTFSLFPSLFLIFNPPLSLSKEACRSGCVRVTKSSQKEKAVGGGGGGGGTYDNVILTIYICF